MVNKYYDLAKAGDPLAVEHYKTLKKNAADCIRCGHCDSRCPFSVRQSERMQEIRAFFPFSLSDSFQIAGALPHPFAPG